MSIHFTQIIGAERERTPWLALLITGLSSLNYSSVAVTSRLRVDSTIRIAQLRAVLKRMSQRPMWYNFVAALVICAPIACSEQILPQLVAQIASLDRDHGISLRVTNNGVDLVLTHDAHAVPHDEAQCLALSAAQPAHIIHFISGPATAKPSASLMVSNARDLVPYCSRATVTEWRTFVPPLLLAYSRPPPDELSIPLVDRSTLLLI
jgi:hypothetical protein